MDRKITDLESIIDPISVLFRRARATGHLDVPAPNNMLFDVGNTITLVWNLTERTPEDAILAFDRIKSLANAEFDSIDHEDIGIVTYTGMISWHGNYPDVFFRVVLPIEVKRCPD